MSGSGLNLTGEWWGNFSYPKHIVPTTPFIASIVDDGSKITGTIIEPNNLTGGSSLNAFINGVRNGDNVDFTKVYPNAPYGYDTPVDYVGNVSADGNTISGVWSLIELDGTFEMHRETAVAIEQEQSAEEALM